VSVVGIGRGERDVVIVVVVEWRALAVTTVGDVDVECVGGNGRPCTGRGGMMKNLSGGGGGWDKRTLLLHIKLWEDPENDTAVLHEARL